MALAVHQWSQRARRDDLVLQEQLDGVDVSVDVLAEDGAIVAAVARSRVAPLPPGAVVSASDVARGPPWLADPLPSTVRVRTAGIPTCPLSRETGTGAFRADEGGVQLPTASGRR